MASTCLGSGTQTVAPPLLILLIQLGPRAERTGTVLLTRSDELSLAAIIVNIIIIISLDTDTSHRAAERNAFKLRSPCDGEAREQ